MLQFLQGKTHQVYTGVCMMTADMTQMFYEKTGVVMYPADEEQLREYVQTGDRWTRRGVMQFKGAVPYYPGDTWRLQQCGRTSGGSDLAAADER